MQVTSAISRAIAVRRTKSCKWRREWDSNPRYGFAPPARSTTELLRWSRRELRSRNQTDRVLWLLRCAKRLDGASKSKCAERCRDCRRDRSTVGEAADKAENLAGCKSPYRQLPVFGRLAYPERAEVTKHDVPGRRSPDCPAAVFAAVGTIWGASKLGGRNITKYLQPRNATPREVVIRGQTREADPTLDMGKADGAVEETGASTRSTAGAWGPASKKRFSELTSGSCRGQRGLVTPARTLRTRLETEGGESPTGAAHEPVRATTGCRQECGWNCRSAGSENLNIACQAARSIG